MYRFLLRPKWIGFHLLVLAGVIAMVYLGFWQLRRLDARQEFNAAVEARYDAAPEGLDDVLGPTSGRSDLEQIEWRPVTASGRYLADDQILIVNRSQNGRAGDNVVVPLELDDGRVLLVNRGFTPLGETSTTPPTGTVEVLGRLRPTQERRLGQLSDPAEGELDEAQRVDIERLSAQLPGEVVPMYLDLIESVPAGTVGWPEPVAAPDVTDGPHLSYAVQWFLFSAAVAVGWVLAVRHSVGTRRHSGSQHPGDESEIEADELASH